MEKKWLWTLDLKENLPFEKKEFWEIIDFFLWQCPVEYVSKRTKNISELNKDIHSVVAILKKEIPVLKSRWKTISSTELENFLKSQNVFSEIKDTVCFAYHTNYIKNESNSKSPIRTKTKGFFYCIRCAFAHGDFSVRIFNGKTYYQLQNSVVKEGKLVVKGQILLEENMLLKIRDIVTNWKKYKRKKKEKTK